jgi:hypothetical protein
MTNKKQAMYREQALQSYQRTDWQGIKLPRLFGSRSIFLQWLCWLATLIVGAVVSMMPITLVKEQYQPEQWNVATSGDNKILSFPSSGYRVSSVMILQRAGTGWVQTQLLERHNDSQSVIILDKTWEQSDELILTLEVTTSLWTEITGLLTSKGDS